MLQTLLGLSIHQRNSASIRSHQTWHPSSMPGSPSWTLKQAMSPFPEEAQQKQHVLCQHLESNFPASWIEEPYSLINVFIRLVVLITMLLIWGNHNVICILQISPLVWPQSCGYLLTSSLGRGPGHLKRCLVARPLPEWSSNEGSTVERLQTLFAGHFIHTVAPSRKDKLSCYKSARRKSKPIWG